MSIGPTIRIGYHVPDEERRREAIVAGDGTTVVRGSDDPKELGIEVRGDTEERRVYVRPHTAVVIDVVQATLALALDDADALYLNGYNSWTDSVERPVRDRMWGLTRVPRAVVDKYVLDGGGDYRFVAEDARPGHQHGFGYGYLRQGDEVLLFGSLNEDTGLTLIREDADAGTLTFVKEPPARVVAAGEMVELLSLAVCGGTLEAAVERWLGLCGVASRPARPVIGYSSWYRHYGAIDAWKLEADLLAEERVIARLAGKDLAVEGTAAGLGGGSLLEGLDVVFQIDDGYAKVGDWLECDAARFPEGLSGLSTKAAKADMVAGLWLAPFVCERNSRTYVEHADWLMRDEAGEPVTTGSQWSGGVALDTRNPEVRRYVRKVLRTVTREWGFGLLKLDFLYAACLVPHDGFNRGELMADALDLLRGAVGDDVRLLLCGVPLVSAFGRCEYCRIGADVGLDWDDKPPMRLLHRERVSTKWSLANARGRTHLDGRAFRCDPDILFLREEGVRFTPAQREEMLATDTSCGGVLFTSDDMGSWGDEQLAAYRQALIAFRAHNGL